MSAVIGDGGDFQLFGGTMHITWRTFSASFLTNVEIAVLIRRRGVSTIPRRRLHASSLTYLLARLFSYCLTLCLSSSEDDDRRMNAHDSALVKQT